MLVKTKYAHHIESTELESLCNAILLRGARVGGGGVRVRRDGVLRNSFFRRARWAVNIDSTKYVRGPRAQSDSKRLVVPPDRFNNGSDDIYRVISHTPLFVDKAP